MCVHVHFSPKFLDNMSKFVKVNYWRVCIKLFDNNVFHFLFTKIHWKNLLFCWVLHAFLKYLKQVCKGTAAAASVSVAIWINSFDTLIVTLHNCNVSSSMPHWSVKCSLKILSCIHSIFNIQFPFLNCHLFLTRQKFTEYKFQKHMASIWYTPAFLSFASTKQSHIFGKCSTVRQTTLSQETKNNRASKCTKTI